MGLSNEAPKYTVAVLDAMLELAKVGKLFEEYGLEKLIKDAYALSEQEQRKADEARGNIASYQALVSEQKKRAGEIEQAEADLESERTSIKSEWLVINNERDALKKRTSELESQAADLRSLKATLQERERGIEVLESKANQNNAAADKARKEAEAELAAIKARAAQINKLVEEA